MPARSNKARGNADHNQYGSSPHATSAHMPEWRKRRHHGESAGRECKLHVSFSCFPGTDRRAASFHGFILNPDRNDSEITRSGGLTKIREIRTLRAGASRWIRSAE